MLPRRLFLVCNVLAILTLILQVGSNQDVQASSPVTLAGTFITLWGDGTQDTQVAQAAYFLTRVQGDTILLTIDESLLTSAGGVMALNRKAVVVQGTWLEEGTSLRVFSLALAQGEPGGTQGIYGPQPWVSVLCKFADIPAEPNDLDYFQGMYSSEFPGLDHFWREQSFDLANLEGSGAFGWFVLPHERAYYLPGGNLDWWTAAEDCTAVADSTVDFSPYVGINLMFNADLDCCAWGGTWYACLDGVCQDWRTTWEPPWGYQNIGVIGHETGHGFGLPHSYWNLAVVYDNKWDVMSDLWSNGDRGGVDPVYGTMGQHTISYHKDMLGWIEEAQRVVIGTGEIRTITLERLALPQTGNNLAARVLVDDSPNHFLTVEARQLAGYDSWLPPILYGLEGAVVLHDVHVFDDMPARVIDIDQNGNTGDLAAMWLPGETYITPTLGIEMSVLSATDSGFVVTISNRFTHMSEVDVTGPVEGTMGETIPFTATVSPENTTTPITFTWEATGVSPVTHVRDGVVDWAQFSWEEAGTKVITVTASNAGGTVVNTQYIAIGAVIPIVSLSGPELGSVGAENTFTATVVPEDVSLPITYTWQASGQMPITNTGGLSDTVTFAWDEPGTQVITVTAGNVFGWTMDRYEFPVLMPPANLDLAGPVRGGVQESQVFTATVSPITTTLPITYVWTIDDQWVFTHTSGLSDWLTFQWDQSGPHTLSVSAYNPVGTVVDPWTITLFYRWYLPIGMRD